ncbi:hypothetical protein CONCODRAFT_87188 [Conidiobolus coronatus NRRL 28638]|uniref:Uncharacterized protein n=1 Tax=Conidiobolus coronatus (strain ATCC 28846 / CBS 209.66 / NRRL 28638) TaxID=796925 RepID=A0A137NWF4_CONC2|nr:hypothetical protein CONCODRAFT_87188 [Conidiobolus coronatus NRRL 28638]|eukprot:KXN67018.1 hypothetical protein CONCODRAFT_87188 [Conidiobolus coronatus NRRL 28638]
MSFELVYTITLIPSKNGQAFELTPSNSTTNPSQYIFDYIGKHQFSLYKDKLKIIEVKSFTEICDYSFKFGNLDVINNYRLYSKSIGGTGYKVTRKPSHESKKVNWSWNYSATSSSYTLVNKNASDRELARISGLSLDGQDKGIICMNDDIPEDYKVVVLMTACIIWNRNLLSKWMGFLRRLNGKKQT